MSNVQSSWRTREIEEFTNLYFVHPLAGRLTPLLARMQVSPNAVSLIGMACGMLAGWAYYHYEDLRFASGGFLLMVVWHVLDGVDGQLARMSNRQSEFGKLIDGIADNVTFLSVYAGLGLSMSRHMGPWVWLIIALAAVAHSLQAAIYEAQRQEYDFWGWDKKSAELKSADALRTQLEPSSFIQRVVYALGRTYARMQYLVAGVDPEMRRTLTATLAEKPQRAGEIRRGYRESFSSLVRAWSVMSSNYRTIAIFVCAVIGFPLLYFLLELIGLSLLTWVMLRRQASRRREFLRFLDRQAFSHD